MAHRSWRGYARTTSGARVWRCEYLPSTLQQIYGTCNSWNRVWRGTFTKPVLPWLSGPRIMSHVDSSQLLTGWTQFEDPFSKLMVMTSACRLDRMSWDSVPGQAGPRSRSRGERCTIASLSMHPLMDASAPTWRPVLVVVSSSASRCRCVRGEFIRGKNFRFNVHFVQVRQSTFEQRYQVSWLVGLWLWGSAHALLVGYSRTQWSNDELLICCPYTLLNAWRAPCGRTAEWDAVYPRRRNCTMQLSRETNRWCTSCSRQGFPSPAKLMG